MPSNNGPRHGKGKSSNKPQSLKRKRAEEDLSTLVQRVEDLDLKESYKSFSDLPLSEPTASGLSSSHYKTLTDIQSRAISHALKGRDILGAAKTGSGKTLAFLVPVLENLYRKQWAEYDGLGALILSPTRELAIQIFEVLRKVGRYHNFSAGLVIGGKSLREEQERLGRMNILVCTPGRMLQHLDQTALFDTNNLQMLVMDEADRIMDMGFQKTVDAIVGHLPQQRQTLLFSATQTKKVSDLARLSLKDPEYVAVHEAASSATPATLQQHYVVTPLPQKLDVLWSFIRSNLKSKTIVFLSSGKQVRFVYESFRHMQPGIPLMHLHGRQKQGGRLDITTNFSQAKHAVLFSTDIAARGLDFPAVDWVIQLDCPEDADTYIHRVGRTARYEREGRAVLFLDPSEEKGMLQRLEQKKVKVERINIKANKQQSVKSQLQNMCFKDPELKYLGQKAFISYVKSVYVQKDKEIFNIKELKLEDLAHSMGLPGAPRIKFIKGDDTKERKNAPRASAYMSSDDESGDDEEEKTEKTAKRKEEPRVRTKYDRMFERQNQDVLADHYSKLINDDGTLVDPNQNKGESDDEDDFLSVKRRFAAGDEGLDVRSSDDDEEETDKKDIKTVHIDGRDPLVVDSKRREKLLKSKKKLLKFKGKGTKLVYDDEGNAHELYEMEDEDQFKARGDAKDQQAQFLAEETQRTRQADLEDKAVDKQKRREKKEKRKQRERELLAEEEAEEREAQLAPFEGGDDYDGGDYSQSEAEEPAPRPNKKVRVQEPDSDNEVASRYKRDKRPAAPKGPEPIQTLEDLESLATGLLG
ncbi:RNA-dependent ATPase HCA4 [Aspergillus melleus]|uniref:RNA-dependent ATPase HCA4 n=1 Tax=Aspergillus melleus TaxID=138277 RepID=UPI001E8DAEFD|nr:ATP-dependent RNA helicase dbp4 [Aspergillus melleus]KAH8433429.1 ATP-dependent RNA helicase dbp4 [Aspergillus melleus]